MLSEIRKPSSLPSVVIPALMRRPSTLIDCLALLLAVFVAAPTLYKCRASRVATWTLWCVWHASPSTASPSHSSPPLPAHNSCNPGSSQPDTAAPAGVWPGSLPRCSCRITLEPSPRLISPHFWKHDIAAGRKHGNVFLALVVCSGSIPIQDASAIGAEFRFRLSIPIDLASSLKL